MQIGLHTRIKPGAEERYDEYYRAVMHDASGEGSAPMKKIVDL